MYMVIIKIPTYFLHLAFTKTNFLSMNILQTIFLTTVSYFAEDLIKINQAQISNLF